MDIEYKIFSLNNGSLEISLKPVDNWSNVDLKVKYPEGEKKWKEIEPEEAANIISPNQINGYQEGFVYNESRDKGDEEFDLSIINGEEVNISGLRSEEFLNKYDRPDIKASELDRFRRFEKRLGENMRDLTSSIPISSDYISMHGWMEGLLKEEEDSIYLSNEKSQSYAEINLKSSKIDYEELRQYIDQEIELYGCLDANFDTESTLGNFVLQNPLIYKTKD